MDNLKQMLIDSNYAHKEIKINNKEDEASYRWNNKKVLDKLTLLDESNMQNAVLVGDGGLEITNEFENTKLLSLKTYTNVENIIPRPKHTIVIPLNNIDLSTYNRIAVDIYIASVGIVCFYFHISFANPDDESSHAPCLEANCWNHIIWELDRNKRDKVTRIGITPFLMGTPPEGLSEIKVYIKKVVAEKVVPDYQEGWHLEDRIAYSHVGYFKKMKKTALVEKIKNGYFEIYNNKNDLILKKEVVKKPYLGITLYLLDFSEIKKNGEYYIKVDERVTPLFVINDFPYLSSTWKTINFLRMLRCGEDVVNVHSPCHLNCKTVHPDGRMVPNFGGWHDAGDVSQFEICTAEMAHAILDLAEKSKNDYMLYERLKEEAKVGIMWLLRTRFGDGYRALAVSYSIHRSNILKPDNKTVEISKAENGPFENALAAAAEAKSYQIFKEDDKTFALWCLRSAKEDFDFALEGYNKGLFTVRWGSNIDSVVSGSLVLAACEIYKATNDQFYLEIASKYANIITLCQETKLQDWDKPIRGFFYEDIKHTKVLTYEHRGHEQTPLQGLAILMELYPSHKDYNKWLKCIKLYREYVIESMKFNPPYNLLPAHVYITNKFNLERFTIPKSYNMSDVDATNELIMQARSGIKLNEDAYLRIFPVAIHRRGYFATILSKVKGITSINKILKDRHLDQIVINQLEWIFGYNPFASSTMYGEGHNYHPLYVAFSNQIVGALPVGIKTYKHNDMPYWPTQNNSVFKEIWGHTSGKFLWILADLVK